MECLHHEPTSVSPRIFLGIFLILSLAIYMLKSVLSKGKVPPNVPWPAHQSTSYVSRLKGLREQMLDLPGVLLKGHSLYASQGKPYAISTFLEGPTLILPPSKVPWIAKLPSTKASFMDRARDQICLDYTVFDPEFLTKPIFRQLTANAIKHEGPKLMTAAAEEISLMLNDMLGGEATGWKALNATTTVDSLVMRSFNRLLVGKTLSRDHKYTKDITTYTSLVVPAGALLRLVPQATRPTFGLPLRVIVRRLGKRVVDHIEPLCHELTSAQIPVYISELAPSSKRGRVVGCQQWSITWGILIMYYIAYGCSFLEGSAAWRVPWGIQMLPAFALAGGLMFCPESPRWLAKQDRWEDCHNVLALVHAKGDRNAPFVHLELQAIKDMVEVERNNADVTNFELLKPKMINRTHIGVFTQIWSQLSGMNVMMYYISYVFSMAGLTGNVGLYSASIQYVINVFMTSELANAHSAGLMATYGHPAPPGGLNGVPQESWQISGPASKAVIACTYLFVASFAPTLGPVSWIYLPELFPLRVRGKAVALCTAANWTFNFALAYFVPPAFVTIKWKVYILFGVFLTAMTIHIFFMFPETAGKSLEEVEEMFLSGTKAWKTRVQYQTARRNELGDIVDPKKRLSVSHAEEVPGAASTEHVASNGTKV